MKSLKFTRKKLKERPEDNRERTIIYLYDLPRTLLVSISYYLSVQESVNLSTLTKADLGLAVVLEGVNQGVIGSKTNISR